MLEWMFMPYRRYAQFSGRSRRKEYWLFYLFIIIVVFGLSFLAGLFAPSIDPNTGEVSGGGMAGILSTLMMVFYLGSLVPLIAAGVRRMHDVGKSGWFLLIPIYNLILAVTDGEKGPNQYGPDPKGSEGETFS